MINHFNEATPEAVKQALLDAQSSEERIRVFYGGIVTGKSWHEENDVIGYVGNSNGTLKVPILLYNSQSVGGGAILDHCIVAIKSKAHWLYRHPALDLGTWTMTNDLDGYWHVSLSDGRHARFETKKKAQRYIDFMLGKRFTK